MALLTPWLNRASFQNRITLPANFNLDVFQPFLQDLEEIELASLLGKAKVALLITWVVANPNGNLVVEEGQEPTTDSLAMKTLYDLVAPFLVYAAYAEYVFSGDVQPTDTGLVVKTRDSSESLTDTQRAQLHRSYRDKANSRARLVTEFLEAERQSCVASTSGGEARISSSRGKKGSIADSL